MIGLHFDYKKAFDLVPRNLIFKLAEISGFPPKVLAVMQNMYKGLSRFFRIPGGLSPGFKSSCGILQGCPLSVVYMNLIVSIWAKAISAETQAVPKAFADDSMITANSVSAACQALVLTGGFAAITKQQLAIHKTSAWATTTRDRRALKNLRFQGQALPVFLDVKSLGTQLSSSKQRVASHYEPKIVKSHAHGAKCVGFAIFCCHSWSDVCYTKILPNVLFSSEISAPPKSDLGRLRSAITRAVWKKRANRSPDVVLALLHPIHRLDPSRAWVYRCLIQLRRMCLRRPDLIPIMQNLWSKPLTHNNFGPINNIKAALKFLGWTWPLFDVWNTPQKAFNWLQHSGAYFLHFIREGLRAVNLQVASKRKDLSGIHNPVDRHSLNKIFRTLKGYQRGTFNSILCGGFRSAVHFQKAKLVEDPTCPFCSQTEEDIYHIFYDCPAWASIRNQYLDINWSQLREAPPCTRLCAVPLLPTEIAEFCALAAESDQLEDAIPLSADSLEIETIIHHKVILWTDGSCLNPTNPYLKTAGYGVVYDPTRSHVRTISKPLLGVEQSAQRAEIRAVLAALCVENRPCIIRSNSSYVVNSFQKLLAGIPLPYDGEHIDLWRQIQCQLELRLHSAEIEWIKGHANAHHVAIGLSTDLDKACNDAADQAANDGARLHAVPLELQQLYNSHSKQMCQIAALFTEIAVARNNVAKQQKLLTYKPKEKPSENSAKDGFSQYCVHQNTNQKNLPVLKKFPVYHRSLRFRFGELAWQALTWYMEQLRWPHSDSTLGVTWAELCLDFELATGVTLPRGASICAELFGSRLLGRQATWTMETKPNQYNTLEHSVEKVIKQGKVRFQCIVCSRSGAWSDRHKFLRQTCAGYTESPVQAIRRLRLEQSARKCSSDKPLPPATLDEKYIKIPGFCRPGGLSCSPQKMLSW